MSSSVVVPLVETPVVVPVTLKGIAVGAAVPAWVSTAMP